MSLNAWRTIAVIFMILCLVETFLIGYGYYLNNKLEFETNQCYYDICLDYPDAYYSQPVCSCLDYDEQGKFKVIKEVLIN